ncbi:MAG: 1-acyl-sn-glycerol-3-phosphate acyltransferase [Defluviitaleaceae bacterium]|nr:1-acyl-sn-glycerol-3-phosphate acyltransferase [Defluviitaleaceae bacterium]
MWMWKLGRILAAPVYRIIYRFRVTGRENIPLEGGVVLCANHTSYHDVVVLGMTSPRDLHYLAKAELFNGKIKNKFFNLLGAIPVDREKPGMDTLKRVVNVLKEEKPLAIFMQGGRHKDSDDYKAGVALFAIKGKASVVPININSTFKLFSKVHINIGKPISFEEYYGKKVRADDLNIAAQRVMDGIVELGTRD